MHILVVGIFILISVIVLSSLLNRIKARRREEISFYDEELEEDSEKQDW